MNPNSKQYGLILPQKANQGLVRDRPSVFNDSSESDEETGANDWVRKALKRESEKTFQKKQHRLDIQKALEEDPTVYQYDEVYDKIEEKKAELSNAKRQQDKKPRYIQSLLQQAEKRKREHERRNERIIQKEREAEGDKFKDKESFVTSAYRQKLEEFKILEEEEKRQDAIEALTDVSKQKDLSGFYRHLYRQTVSGEQENPTVKQEKDETVEKTSGDPEPEKEERVVRNDTGDIESNASPCGSNGASSIDRSDKRNNSRHYRKRKNTSASSNSEEDDSSKRAKTSTENMDADSDFSVDSDSSESGSDDSVKDKDKSDNRKKERKGEADKANSVAEKNSMVAHVEEDNEKSGKTHTGKRSNEDESSDTTNKKIKEETMDQNEQIASETIVHIKEKERVPKPNIWIKRTVGEVFENALQRYYQRKASKLASKG